MQTVDVVRRYSKTPLKHRMSKYLLEFILDNDDLLDRIVFVSTREFLPDTMMVAQAGAEGSSFELELGAMEREEVSLVNGRLVKQTKKTRATWIHDPVQAVEVLRKFQGTLHVQLKFASAAPEWYEAVTVKAPTYHDMLPEFSRIVREQIDLAVLAITLRNRIDEALVSKDEHLFNENVKMYNEIRERCLWQL